MVMHCLPLFHSSSYGKRRGNPFRIPLGLNSEPFAASSSGEHFTLHKPHIQQVKPLCSVDEAGNNVELKSSASGQRAPSLDRHKETHPRAPFDWQAWPH